MRRPRDILLDVIASILVVLLALWVYEIANAIVLVCQGFSVSFNLMGPVPLGVAGSSIESLSPWTKILQVPIAMGLLLPAGVVLSKKELPAAKAFLIASLGIYLASVYWEALSSLSMVPMDIHTCLYLAGTGALTTVLLRKLGPPLHLWYEPVRNAP